MFKVGDLVKFEVPQNRTGDWGTIVAILELKDSMSGMKGIIFYRVQPILDMGRATMDIKQEHIIERYEKTFDARDGKKNERNN